MAAEGVSCFQGKVGIYYGGINSCGGRQVGIHTTAVRVPPVSEDPLTHTDTLLPANPVTHIYSVVHIASAAVGETKVGFMARPHNASQRAAVRILCI